MDKCKVCGRPTENQPSHDKLCDSCWEVISRLKTFARYEAGKRIMLAALEEAGP